jgi:hypothetical protein
MFHSITATRDRAGNFPRRFPFASFTVFFNAVALIGSYHCIHFLEIVLKIIAQQVNEPVPSARLSGR